MLSLQYNFLKAFAFKEHKFQQGKSRRLLGWDEGACFALAVHVLNELAHGRPAFKPTEGDIHRENSVVLEENEAAQNAQLFTRFSVEDLIGGPYFQLRVVDGGPMLPGDLNNPAPALEQCAAGLTRRKGVFVCINLPRGAHGIMMFRNANDDLYFFDANCGLYRVHSPTPFFQEWVRAAQARFESGYRQVWYVEAR